MLNLIKTSAQDFIQRLFSFRFIINRTQNLLYWGQLHSRRRKTSEGDHQDQPWSGCPGLVVWLGWHGLENPCQALLLVYSIEALPQRPETDLTHSSPNQEVAITHFKNPAPSLLIQSPSTVAKMTTPSKSPPAPHHCCLSTATISASAAFAGKLLDSNPSTVVHSATCPVCLPLSPPSPHPRHRRTSWISASEEELCQISCRDRRFPQMKIIFSGSDADGGQCDGYLCFICWWKHCTPSSHAAEVSAIFCMTEFISPL